MYTNPRPGQYLTHVQSQITRELTDSCHHPGASLLGIIKIWNISKSTTTNQSAWYNRLTSEPRTLAHGIVSMLRTCRLAVARVVDYFHIEDRVSIPGHARTIFCVHVSSLWVSALTFLYSGCSGFITQWKYSLLLEVIFSIYLTHNWRKFMNK